MTRQKISYKTVFQKIWNDSVLSNVISPGILGLLAFLWTFVTSLVKDISIRDVLYETLIFKIELYKFLILIAVVSLSLLIIAKIRRKKNRYIGKFDTEQRVGEFSFRELYNALLTHEVTLPISLQSTSLTKDNLLIQFILFQRQLNVGVSWNEHGDQGVYMYYVLAPTLMSYGLIEKSPAKGTKDPLSQDLLQTSLTGYKFHALLERWRVHNDAIMKDDITKTQSLTNNAT